MEVDAHEDFLASVEAEEVDAEQQGVAEVTFLARRVVHAAGVHDAVEDLRLFASVDVGEPRAADERGGVDPRLASHLARDGRAGELRGQVNRGKRAQGTIERSKQKLHGSRQQTAEVSSGRGANWTVAGSPRGSNEVAVRSTIAASPSSTLPVSSASAAARARRGSSLGERQGLEKPDPRARCL